MARTQAKVKRSDAARTVALRGRVGRPPKALAGNIEERILDAAREVFLERGFDGTSIDEIAERAPASKPTIYARYAGKPALFAAIVERSIGELVSLRSSYTPPVGTVQEQLVGLAMAIVDRAFKESIGLLRVTIGEAYRFPDLSCQFHEVSRKRTVQVVEVLLADTLGSAGLPARRGPSKAPEASAEIFIDLIVLPLLMRALMGMKERTIRKEMPGFVRERVKIFLALHAKA
ncbi:TetR/AcrR family transcriptional regulator [Bradyrhizobium sp. 83012]|uniref:TetR/AcrR family transcriptional regulator n=1 Tax=Bradyrhizobium aeschynomenes TaxID=2734909 RepID=A0ABX2CPN0_9BRAD|nr:TetR/AcrR family transcriptional regulator [Bradyrhizobium aeschynomenes]NPU09315.1 TetR/AcrR family transcriptional regulator [Bradyrhizobium aeschynomenes]NPU69252.1 TetR/AcrR family transcriptional regulator [Bradyrhizobium aeschynomenes]NPV20635.1 TetR/AcrR family transcriptional regulator [Bradyrhizobium aeschynomenes]